MNKKHDLIEDSLIDGLMSRPKINSRIIKLLLQKGGNFTENSIKESCKAIDIDLNSIDTVLFDMFLTLNKKTLSQDTINFIIVYGNLNHVKSLIINKNTFTKDHFFGACENGKVELVNLILNELKKNNVFLDSETIKRAIYIASNEHNLELVEFLLEYDYSWCFSDL